MTLLPINKLPKKPEPLQKNALSGDVIDGGTITNFNSTGIKDEANKSQITIKDSEVVVENDLHIKGTVKVENLEYVSAQVPKLNVREAMMINHHEVLWKDRLGKSVTKSSLTEVGVLKDLQVRNTFYVSDGRVGINTTAPSADFSVLSNGYEIVTSFQESTGFIGTHTHVPFSIGTDYTPRLTCRANGDIVVGSETGKSVRMNVYGRLGIGVKYPDETLEVAGNIKFAERIFTSGEKAPDSGSWSTGSIAWNEKPSINHPVGWVCVKGGKPGSWRPFGLIQ
jgi:hypothetical protein